MVAMPGLIDEESVIRLLWEKLRKGQEDPFDDDAAWLQNSSNKKLLVTKSDMLVATTDAPKQMSSAQMATKSVVSCVSDLAAKGAAPLFCLVSLGFPKKCANHEFVGGLALGFARAQKEYGVQIIGGDINETVSDVVIDCTIFGFSDRIVKRSGARPGDLIGVSGEFGHQSAGLQILLGKAQYSRNSKFSRRAIDSILDPKARLRLGLKISRNLSSCTDSSDGLAISLYHLAESSRVNFVLDRLPMARCVKEFASENKLRADSLVLFGGEEFELVFTFDPIYSKELSRYGVIPIGRVSKLQKEKPSVFYGDKKIPRRGWLQFR
ncbi:MAG: thiamine-phosphate kinase [Nitrososphaerales archaeon]